MRELLELQSGQVAFLTGILAGFSMTAAVQIMRYGIVNRMSQFLFWVATLASMLFLVALYIDVRLTLELTGKANIPMELQERIAAVRRIGTTSATAGLFLFITVLSLLGMIIPRRMTGLVSAVIGFCILCLLVYIWFEIGGISADLYAEN